MSKDDEERDGPEAAEAQPDEAVLERVEEDDADHEFEPFDELDEEFQPTITYGAQADGMPGNSVPETHSDIPALSVETLVCMGDFSKFVVRDEWGEVFAEFQPHEVERAPNGLWRVPLDLATERLEDSARFVVRKHGGHAQVEPIRKPCKHYVRQMNQFEMNAAHRVVYRLCAARRTTEGTFMTVRDRGIWACDMREPRHLESEKFIDDFDELKIKQGRERVYLDMFARKGTNGGAAGVSDRK